MFRNLQYRLLIWLYDQFVKLHFTNRARRQRLFESEIRELQRLKKL